MRARLPAPWNQQPPPDGVGNACADLQQECICTINDGDMYTGRDGCQHCSR
jgi:hypothetical protein